MYIYCTIGRRNYLIVNAFVHCKRIVSEYTHTACTIFWVPGICKVCIICKS